MGLCQFVHIVKSLSPIAMCLSCGREINLIICQKVCECAHVSGTRFAAGVHRFANTLFYRAGCYSFFPNSKPNRIVCEREGVRSSKKGSFSIPVASGFIALFYYHNGPLSPGVQVFISQTKLGRWIKFERFVFSGADVAASSTARKKKLKLKQKQNYKNVQLAEVVSHYSANARGEKSEWKTREKSFPSSVGSAWKTQLTTNSGGSPWMWVVNLDFKLIEFRCAVSFTHFAPFVFVRKIADLQLIGPTVRNEWVRIAFSSEPSTKQLICIFEKLFLLFGCACVSIRHEVSEFLIKTALAIKFIKINKKYVLKPLCREKKLNKGKWVRVK